MSGPLTLQDLEQASSIPMTDTRRERIIEACGQLRAAESSVRVLRGIDWSRKVRERFFERKARALPEVEYPNFDPSPVHAGVREARHGFEDDTPISNWIRRAADKIEFAADLLANTGTPAFLELGAQLFGLPETPQAGTTALELAQAVEKACDEMSGLDLGAPPPACHMAEGVAQRMRDDGAKVFGDRAPEVLVVEELSANALAGPNRIQIRRGACFSDRDVDQLIQHEAFIHVCTSLNGREQSDLSILAASHPGTTRTQEGLAVFAEYISGSLDPDRFRRLADRVLAIQMAIEGADFLEVYRFFLDRDVPAEQSYENTRRVFRGGVLTGGAPFTKDSVYLDGFLRVTNFLRAVVAEGRVDCLLLLFCGKLDIEDIPALAQLNEMGLCRPPLFLPPWAKDRRYLVTYLTYSQFLGNVDLHEHRAHYRSLLAHSPRAAGLWDPSLAES